MRQLKIRNSLLLLLAAVIWGVAFVAQSVGMDYMEPLFFNGIRFLLGGVVLLPLIAVRRGYRKKYDLLSETGESEAGGNGKRRGILLLGGVCCGLALCAASVSQQFGILYTTVGKTGFITTLYIVIVPLLGLFLHRKVKGRIWFAVLLASCGFYLLCITEQFTVGRGELYVFLSAVIFSVHILIIDYFSPKVDGVELSCIQFFVAGVISMSGSLLFEQPGLSGLAEGIVPVLYAGILSCGVAYTLQIVGQKGMDPSVASLVLCMESVVSVLAGWAILGQRLSARELGGCVLVFAAVLLVQLPDYRSKKIDSGNGVS